MQKILVVIPTYNEADNIIRLIEDVLSNTNEKYVFNILVVDDNSPDGTAQLVIDYKKIDNNNSKVFILHREKKLGLGTAYVRGFKYSIEKNYDYVFEMDADFSHDPKYLYEFLDKANEGYDLVVGSRYINGISVLNWPVSRLILSYFANFYSRLITGLEVMDTTAGYCCYRVSSLAQLNLDSVRSNGYSFQIEMKYKFFVKGFKLTEIPILFVDRRAGESKMSKKVVYEAMLMVWKLRTRAFLGKLN